jgi:hypothetical protein
MSKRPLPKFTTPTRPSKASKASKPTHGRLPLRDVGGTRRVLSKEQDNGTNAAPVSLDPGPKRKPGGQKGHRVNPASLANLKKPGEGPRVKGPTLTDDYAHTYVRFRAAGVSALDAVQMFAKGDERMKSDEWRQLAEKWDKDARVIAAWETYNGGRWEDLSEDARIDVALRHHVAQCARVLYTADIDDPNAPMKRVEYAKSVITEKLTLEKAAGDGDRFTAFMEKLVSNAGASLPPVFKGKSDDKAVPALPTLPATWKDS